jgi:hypothetical protein
MNKTPARSRADIQSASQARDELVKGEIAKERAKIDAKTEKLKALRLARDAEQARLDALSPRPPAKARRKPAKAGGPGTPVA